MSAPVASETRRPFSASSEIERVVAGVAEPGRDEHGADLVAIEAGGVRLVVEARTTNMHRG